MNSDLQVWQRFFKDALIPVQFIQTYANKFTENRIRFDMLADLDKSLLNEMGITAIGDCLSILKHAKTIISQIEEKNKLETQTIVVTTNNNDSNAKKRSEVAKRIIETYLSDPEAKPLNETKNNNSSSLSAELISRLNFNPNKFDDQSSTQTSVTKVIVSSTTNDDDQRNKLTKIKRKIDDVYEINNKIDTITNKKEPAAAALEYRGLLKNDSTNNDTNTISKRTSSFILNNNNNTNKSLTTGGFKFENFKIETKNDNVTEKTNNNKKIFDRIGTLKSDSMTKPKIIPITFEKTIINKNATAANSASASVKLSNNNNNKNGSVFSRLSSSSLKK